MDQTENISLVSLSSAAYDVSPQLLAKFDANRFWGSSKQTNRKTNEEITSLINRCIVASLGRFVPSYSFRMSFSTFMENKEGKTYEIHKNPYNYKKKKIKNLLKDDG